MGLTRSLYLKELYVADRYRGQGVGRLLMRVLFETASEHGCSRVEWTTDRDNTGAQAFYDMLGVTPQPSKIFYRVEDTGAGSTYLADRIARYLRVPCASGSCPDFTPDVDRRGPLVCARAPIFRYAALVNECCQG